MFRSTAHNLRVWWAEFSQDILGADLGADVDAGPEACSQQGPEHDITYFREHPHRRVITPRRRQRDGQVPERPAYCLSPVRAPGRRGDPEPLSR